MSLSFPPTWTRTTDYGIIILRSVLDENGDELFESIDDDDELQDVYEHFSVLLFDDEDEE